MYGPDTRYMVQKGRELIFIFTRPNNQYEVIHYDMVDDICNELTISDGDKGVAYCEVDYETMLKEVMHFLEHNNYRWGSEWCPVDTEELLDISSEDFEKLLHKEDINYNRQKAFLISKDA